MAKEIRGSQMYYIALVADQELEAILHGYKLELQQLLGCKAALKSPAHITLIPPFFWANGLSKILMDTFGHFRSSRQPFELEIDGFGHFRTDVLFARPVDHHQLFALQREVTDYFQPLLGDKLKNRFAFNPHITLANRDLKAADFPQAWALLKDRTLRGKWLISAIHLLRHTGKEWEIIATNHFYKQ